MIVLRLFLAQFRAFWRLRARVDDAGLGFRRVCFAFRARIGEEAQSASAILQIARLTLFDLMAALLVSAGVWWTNTRLSFFSTTIDDAAYIQLASGIAAIGGIFIGLYYAAITAVMTAVYARMPSSVSDLLMQERFGNTYMRFVATLTFTAINLLALQAMGIATSTVGTPLLALGSGVAVFGFVKLGTWAFRLFDPTAVSSVVFRDLRALFSQVVVGGYQWRSTAFQRYAQRRCAQRLQSLHELTDACKASKYLRDEPLVRLAANTLSFAEFSVEQRPKIPTKSLWFPQSYAQLDWYRTADTQTSIAHHTGTMLQPQILPDTWWIEKQCERVGLNALESLFERRQLASARSLMSAFESYVDTLSRHGWVTEGLAITDRLEDLTIAAALDAGGPSEERLVDRIALLDCIARLRITCVLRAGDWADALDAERLRHALNGVDWLRSSTPYSLGLHAYSLECAEWLAERLAFERSVSSQVTPQWYCGELLAQQEAEAIARAIAGLYRDAFGRIWAVVDRALERRQLWEAACLLSDALHYVRKLQGHLERIQGAMTRVSADRRIQKLPWPAEDFESVEADLDQHYAKAIERMTVVIPRLTKRPKDLPDYPGQFLHAATEYVFECVIKQDVATLAKIFPGTFLGCLAMHNALRTPDLEPSDPWLEGALSLAFAPILDLVELSGYSYLLSEVFPEHMTWPVIAQKWDEVLDAQKGLGGRILAIIAFSKGQFALAPRSILRTSWQQRLERILTKLPTKREGHVFAMSLEIDHPSAFVRTVVHPGPFTTTYDGADIFTATYLLARPDIARDAAHRQALELAREVGDGEERTAEPEPEAGRDEDL